MLKITTAKNSEEISRLLRSRDEKISAQVQTAVGEIVADVRTNGDGALRRLAEKFDGGAPESFRVAQADIDAAYESIDKDLRAALILAAENIRDYHSRQKPKAYIISEKEGIVLGMRVRALTAVGIYVPGGTAAYPSTVLMNAIPAKVAGVPRVVMATPAKSGVINKAVLAAAKIAGVDEVYAVGGAQAIAALAFGTESIAAVDKITGPGNVYVAEAKRRLFGVVDIDMIAGPSEILIVADNSADPRYIAADMLSQAEHDVMASAIVLCLSNDMAKRISAEVDRRVSLLPRAEIALRALENHGLIVVCEDVKSAVALADIVAPEHLELMVESPFDYLGMVQNAGSVFLGKYSPEPLGDYFSGTNHVLPTGGTARFASPLSVDDFVKKSSFTYYTKAALSLAAPHILAISEAERLRAHGAAVALRMERDDE